MTRKKFNWLTTLRRLAKRKTAISYAEHLRLRINANSWPTCACGKLCKKLPRFESGAPRDRIAQMLGLDFTNQISHGQWKLALRTFLQIEARTAVLLRQQAKERKKR